MAVAGSNRHGDTNPPAPRGRRGANGLPANPPKLAFTIPSQLAAGREVQKKILEQIERSGYRGHNFFAINLALEEALANAIKHGNRLDPHKLVRIEARITPRRAEIMIEDEGAGFDRTGVPDPTACENLEKCSGRGILLIESYMTRVTWTRGGRRLRMIKVNEPEPQ